MTGESLKLTDQEYLDLLRLVREQQLITLRATAAALRARLESHTLPTDFSTPYSQPKSLHAPAEHTPCSCTCKYKNHRDPECRCSCHR